MGAAVPSVRDGWDHSVVSGGPVPLVATDVVVVPAEAVPHPAAATHKRAGDTPVALTDQLALVVLPGDEAEAYMDACEPAHLNYKPKRQYGQLYSFVRSPAPHDERTYAFDPDGLIQTALQLSRLVVSNSHCTDYAARRVEGSAVPGSLQIAALLSPGRFYAFHPVTDKPDWLDHTQAEQLGRLLRSYLRVQPSLPKRIKRAMQMLEFSYRTQFYEIAYVHVVTGLEALLKTYRYGGATEQFKRRVPLLARKLGITGMTARRAERFYGARSASVHGSGLRVTTVAPANRELAAMQHVLARALAEAIESREFRALFRTAPTVRATWQVTWRGRNT